MKISKSKQELARIISENGGWRDGAEFAAQGGNPGHVGFASVAPVRHGKIWDMTLGFAGKFLADEILPNWHQTVLSRDEYFHLYPAPDADGRIKRDENGIISIEYNKDNQEVVAPGELNADGWWIECIKPELCCEVKEENKHEHIDAKPTIEQLAADYRNAKDYSERKQQEADYAKADADEKLRVLELAGEALGLLVSPITERQEPELVITDWRQLKVGDLVEITATSGGVNIGEAATVIAIDENNENFPVTVTFPKDKYPLEYCYERPPATWRFIRRP